MIDYIAVAKSTKEFAPGGASAELVFARINHLRRMMSLANCRGSYTKHNKVSNAKKDRYDAFSRACNREIQRLKEVMK